eukprot:gene8962-11272_t
MVQTIGRWQCWDKILYDHYPSQRSEDGTRIYNELTNLTDRMQRRDIFLDGSRSKDMLALVVEKLPLGDSYEGESQELVAYLNKAENEALPRLFENAPFFDE